MDQSTLEKLQPVNVPPWDGDPLFRVTSADLIRSLDVATIEARETVHDPLGAAPAQPFGFLYPTWLKFRGDLKDHDELWLFKSTYKVGWRIHEIRFGYAKVTGSTIDWHFVTEVVEIPINVEIFFKEREKLLAKKRNSGGSLD